VHGAGGHAAGRAVPGQYCDRDGGPEPGHDGALAGLPLFWPLPSAFLSNAAAAGGLALINSMGQVAGFVSPFLVGWIKDATGSTALALTILSSMLFAGARLVLVVPARPVNR